MGSFWVSLAPMPALAGSACCWLLLTVLYVSDYFSKDYQFWINKCVLFSKLSAGNHYTGMLEQIIIHANFCNSLSYIKYLPVWMW